MTRARGASMILALFLLVTLSALGAFLLSIYAVQQQTTTQDELAQRAYQAARGGLEWGVYQLLRKSTSGFTTACNGTVSPAETVQTIPFGATSGSLSGFYAKVTCTTFGTETEGGTTVRTYKVKATGCNDANCTSPTLTPTYVERELQVSLAN
jgi:MSHA biogenesis protein MshP